MGACGWSLMPGRMKLVSGPRILDPITRRAIIASLKRGEKTRAIAFYRLTTGASSGEARRAIEFLRVQNGLPDITVGLQASSESLLGATLAAVERAIGSLARRFR